MTFENHVHEIRDKGYTVIKKVITEKTCKKYKLLLEQAYSDYSYKYATDGEKNELSDKTGEKVVYNLHNKDYSWFKLFENQKTFPIVTKLLQEGSYKNNEPIYEK